MITIVDYGMGNFGSVLNMLKKIGVKATISSSHDEILNAGKLILPGVGAFDAAMNRIQQSKEHTISVPCKRQFKRVNNE